VGKTRDWHLDSRTCHSIVIQIHAFVLINKMLIFFFIQNVSVGNRTHIRHGRWNIGLLGIFNVTALSLIKKDLYVGYLEKDYELHFRANQDWAKPTHDWQDLTKWFSSLSCIGIWRRSLRDRYGLQVFYFSNVGGLQPGYQ
jgi:hypothetical protein